MFEINGLWPERRIDADSQTLHLLQSADKVLEGDRGVERTDGWLLDANFSNVDGVYVGLARLLDAEYGIFGIVIPDKLYDSIFLQVHEVAQINGVGAACGQCQIGLNAERVVYIVQVVAVVDAGDGHSRTQEQECHHFESRQVFHLFFFFLYYHFALLRFFVNYGAKL